MGIKFRYISVFIFICSLLSAQNQPKFSGLMFGDYYYYSDNITPANINMNGFQFRRIYFTVDYSIAENFDTRFRLESDQSANSNTGGGKLGVMVKDAYLKWKEIFSGSDLVVGIAPTPAFEVSEAAWSYRSLEKTILDLNGIVSSRDFGIDLKGRLTEGGSLNYWLKFSNNSGNGPETDKYKRYAAMIQIKPLDGFQATIYSDYSAYSQKNDVVTQQDKENNAFVGALFLNYQQQSEFGLGFEAFIKSQQNNYYPDPTTALQNQNGSGISLWGWVSFSDILRLVGRFDSFDPNTDRANDGNTMILGGLDFKVAKNVSIIPNIQIFNYQNNSDHQNISERVTFYFTF